MAQPEELFVKVFKDAGKWMTEMTNDAYEAHVAKFTELMKEIGEYAYRKYGDKSFKGRVLAGDNSRIGLANRAEWDSILEHAYEHLDAYQIGEVHDKFGKLEYQLAAAAFNIMMEAFYLEKEKIDDGK